MGLQQSAFNFSKVELHEFVMMSGGVQAICMIVFLMR